MLQSVGTRALAVAMSEEAGQLADLGAEEAAEGLARLATSAGLAIGSEALAETGAELVAEGLVEAEIGLELEDLAEDVAAEGVAEIAEGAAELGAAAAWDAANEARE
jgi:hypothetical protein